MKQCSHFRKSGETRFKEGHLIVSCWGCDQSFTFSINNKPPLWVIERLKGILTAVKIFESVQNDDGTTRLNPIESNCCKYG
jgi:hypothetical protein